MIIGGLNAELKIAVTVLNRRAYFDAMRKASGANANGVGNFNLILHSAPTTDPR